VRQMRNRKSRFNGPRTGPRAIQMQRMRTSAKRIVMSIGALTLGDSFG
jgi:hypothetical protein